MVFIDDYVCVILLAVTTPPWWMEKVMVYYYNFECPQVHQQMPGFSRAQVLAQWKKCNPSRKKGPFNRKEDNLFLKVIRPASGDTFFHR